MTKQKLYTTEKNVGVKFVSEAAAGSFQRRFSQAVLNLAHKSVERAIQLRQPEVAGVQLVLDVVVNGSQSVHGAMVVVRPRCAADKQPRCHAELDSEEWRRRRRRTDGSAARLLRAGRHLLDGEEWRRRRTGTDGSAARLLLEVTPPTTSTTARPQRHFLRRA